MACTVRSACVRYEVAGTWLANIYTEKHSDRSHKDQEDVYYLVTGDGSHEVSLNVILKVQQKFADFTSSVVSRSEWDCDVEEEEN